MNDVRTRRNSLRENLIMEEFFVFRVNFQFSAVTTDLNIKGPYK